MDTDHARAVLRRTLQFQRDSGLTWQQGSAGQLNQVAVVLNEPLFERDVGVRVRVGKTASFSPVFFT